MKRVNRILTCKVTGKEITVKPDRYDRLVSYYGSEKKVNKNFVSYSVEKECRIPSFLFWFTYCKEFVNFSKKVKTLLSNFKESNRSIEQVQILQNESIMLCNKSNVDMNNIEFIQDSDNIGRYVSGIKIKNIPFIKEYTINL